MSKKEVHTIILPVQFSIKVTCEIQGDVLMATTAAFNPFLEDDRLGDAHPINEAWRACLECPPIMDNHELYTGWPDYEERVIRELSAKVGKIIKWDGQQQSGEEES